MPKRTSLDEVIQRVEFHSKAGDLVLEKTVAQLYW